MLYTMKSPYPIFFLIVCGLISLSTPILTLKKNLLPSMLRTSGQGHTVQQQSRVVATQRVSENIPVSQLGVYGLILFLGICEPSANLRSLLASKIANLTKSLERNWPSLSCPSHTSSSNSEKLWMQEWEKYGTCAESLFRSQYQYFHAALSLRKKVDMLRILSNAGIHPNGSFYNMTAILGAIQKATIYFPELSCNTDRSGNKQLYQIILCGETAGTKITDCLGPPRSNTGQCPERFKFPPLQ